MQGRNRIAHPVATSFHYAGCRSCTRWQFKRVAFLFSAVLHCLTDNKVVYQPRVGNNIYIRLRCSAWRDNALSFLKKAWHGKVRRFGRVLHESSTSVKLFPVPPSSLERWHPDSHRAMGSVAVNIDSRALSSAHYARSTMFQRHAALLVASNAECLISGFDFQI